MTPEYPEAIQQALIGPIPMHIYGETYEMRPVSQEARDERRNIVALALEGAADLAREEAGKMFFRMEYNGAIRIVDILDTLAASIRGEGGKTT